MFLITKPTEDAIRQFIKQQKGGSFSYEQVGISRDGGKPDGYTADHNREQIGKGRLAFERAKTAIRQWKMFDLSFTELYFDNTPIEVGQTVAILIKHFGFWSLNAARIVYTLDESTNEMERFGFAYGTLDEHGERGEERFTVEHHKTDESVWYDLYAFSQPQHILAKIGYPLSRYLQKEFARQSKLAMKKAV